ncbi:hypothetical protein LEN26_006628 [Aphanomyces euteiches]|nr:hypothetical protein AeMF1_000316 [Aphanomyces euteiches]KAH9135002.1 hypothetical protein LEN26_006628 [Aphanomyces euteiches]KAH9191270.1 hypothetical protein AeNC1_006755 [Aphanomyces euteiches]
MAANIAPQRHRMLALKKWLQVWYLATTSDEPDEVDDGNIDVTVTLHVQGDKPEQDRQVSRSSLLPQSIISSPPPQGCFGQEGTFVQLYIADTSWVDLLLANNAHLVGSVVAPVCGKDCCIVDVVNATYLNLNLPCGFYPSDVLPGLVESHLT